MQVGSNLLVAIRSDIFKIDAFLRQNFQEVFFVGFFHPTQAFSCQIKLVSLEYRKKLKQKNTLTSIVIFFFFQASSDRKDIRDLVLQDEFGHVYVNLQNIA